MPVDSPIDSKPLKEIKQMLESEKNSSNSTSVNDTSHTFVPTPNVRNGFRRKKGDSPFVYNMDLKVKKEKKQSNYTNPDPWARIVGSRNTAAIYMDGIATTALFDTGAEIQLVSKQFCEENDLEIQPIEKLTECSTMNGEVFGYEGFVEVNVQIPGRDFSENHLFLVTSEISHQKEIPVVLGTYFIDSLSGYLHGIDKEEFDSLDYTVKQAYLSWVEAARIREKYGCEPPLGVVKTTKPVTIYAGERKEIHGITKIKHGGYSVNCISEPAMEKALPKGLKLITGYSPLGAKIFSTLDLKAGYWQVEMAEECKAYAAFTCGPLGFYEFDTMPFGATNAPATFQRLMHDCLGDLNMRWCIVYLDDIIIFSDTKEEHLKRLEAVFQKLAAAGLKLKPSKCFLFREEIEYLGHVVSGKGISTNPKKVEAVTKWPTPKTVYDVRSFLGFVGYYKRFIKDFSKISKPIREVITGLENQSKRTAKKTLIEWTEAANSAFETLKELCTSTPILAYPDYQLPFILHTDSSSEGLGAVLYQKQEGKLRVIAYASRSVSKTESNYPAHKLEFLALKWAVCEKFHEYLYGTKTFDIYTDNNPLTCVLTSAKLDACGQRWVAKLANYNFTIRYKCGQSNVEADALSRISWPEVLSDEDIDVDLECMDTHDVVSAVLTGTKTKSSLIESISCSSQIIPDELDVKDNSTTALDWVKLQRNDPNLSVIIKLIESDQLFKRKLHRKDSSEVKVLLRIRKSLKLS